MTSIQEKNKIIIDSNFIRYFVLIITGSFLALAFAPFNWFLVGAISITVLFVLTNRAKNYSTIFYQAIAYGFGFFLAGNYWIAISLLVDAKQHGWLIPFAITLIPLCLSIYIGLTCIFYKFIINKLTISNLSAKIFIFSLIWLFFEILRSNLFSGFPWNLIGYVWLFNINIAQFASIFGVYGLSILAIITYLLPCYFIDIKNNKIRYIDPRQLILKDKLFIIIILILLIILSIYGKDKIANSVEINKNYQIRVIQANIKQDLKWDPEKKYQNLLTHINLSNKDSHHINMVLWSEASIPYFVNNEQVIELLGNYINKNITLISGGLRYNNDKIYNSIFAIRNKSIIQHYDKRHLVPFGEYVPLKKFIPFITKITNGAQDFSRGSHNQIISIDNIAISPLICYEAIFSRYAKISQLQNIDILVNLTNDAWFGDSIGPYQHLAMSQMRAIETSRPLIRVANTGISAYIDSNGIVEKKLPLNESGYFDINLKTSNKITIFNKINNLFNN